MAAKLYTPLPFGSYYYQTQTPMYYQTIQRPSYYQSLTQEYKHHSDHSNGTHVDASGYKNIVTCIMCLPVCLCPCCIFMKLSCYNALHNNPDGGETTAFPVDNEPVTMYYPPVTGIPQFYPTRIL